MKRRGELIILALEYYRNRALSDKVLDMSMAELSDKEWSREDIKSLLREYSSIDYIIQKIKEADEYIKRVGIADTVNELSIDKYNTLYFMLTDLLR